MTTLANLKSLNLGPDIEIRHGLVFDIRDIRETTTGQSWEDSQHVHRTGDHWTVALGIQEMQFTNEGEGKLRDLNDFGLYDIKLLDGFGTKLVHFDGYYVGDVSAEVRGDHSDLEAPVRAYIEAVGIPTWFLADHSNFTEEIWDAVVNGDIEPTLATACEMLAAIHEQEALRDWEPKGSLPPDPFLDEDDEGEPYCSLHPLDRGLTRRVNALCREAGMDVADLADASGIDFTDLSFILMGQSTWTVGELYLVSQALGVTPTELTRQAEIIADEEGNR